MPRHMDFNWKDTARAAIFCRKGLEQISKERIREELFHFLVGAGAGKVLSSFWQIFAKILPECGEKAAEWEKLADRIDRASEDLIVRLAILCSDPVRAQAMISRLQLSRKMADEVQTLLQWKEDPSLPLQTSMKYLYGIRGGKRLAAGSITSLLWKMRKATANVER